MIGQIRNERWAHDVAVPEVMRLVEAEQFTAAFDLARRPSFRILPAQASTTLPRMDMIRETLNWLDRYQPVASR